MNKFIQLTSYDIEQRGNYRRVLICAKDIISLEEVTVPKISKKEEIVKETVTQITLSSGRLFEVINSLEQVIRLMAESEFLTDYEIEKIMGTIKKI
jgi:hypothetical protein